MIKEFKEFILRGNVLDLAVGVVIGSAFTAIVNNVVEGLITPLISLVFSLLFNTSQDKAFAGLIWEPVKGVEFDFGLVISAIITFLITAFVLFLVVKGANTLRNRVHPVQEDDEPVVTAEDYLAEIRDLLKSQANDQTTPTTKTPSDLSSDK